MKSRLQYWTWVVSAGPWIVLAGVFVIFSSSASDRNVLPAGGRNFLVFDGLLYRNKPDLAKFGMLPIKPVSQLWRPGVSKSEVDEATTREAMLAVKDFDGLIYLDIENWPVCNVPDSVIQESLRKLTRIALLTRETSPAAKFGFYSLMPERVYWPIVNNDSQKILDWQKCAERAETLAQHVDVIFPSLYTFYDDETSWKIYAEKILREARRYKKPVYAFLWPDFHDSNKQLKGTRIPGKFWRAQLDLVRRNADGIVIWGGWQKEWDDQAEWWNETRDFLAKMER